MTTRPRKIRGMTLLELMITLAIAGLLAAIAVPSFIPFVENNRYVTQINELQTSLNLARSEAIKRNNNVSVCKRDRDAECHGHDNHWHHGWLVFVDNDADGVIDAGDEVLRIYDNLKAKNKLFFSIEEVTYASNGLASSGTGDSFALCEEKAVSGSKGLVIGPSGRPRLALDSDSNGIPEDIDGTDLVCI